MMPLIRNKLIIAFFLGNEPSRTLRSLIRRWRSSSSHSGWRESSRWRWRESAQTMNGSRCQSHGCGTSVRWHATSSTSCHSGSTGRQLCRRTRCRRRRSFDRQRHDIFPAYQHQPERSFFRSFFQNGSTTFGFEHTKFFGFGKHQI